MNVSARICGRFTLLSFCLAGSMNVSAANGLVNGQFHLLPVDQDVQNITLVGVKDGHCSEGLSLRLVDDWGKVDSEPFEVPAQSVFLLTDATAVGNTTGSHPGAVPLLYVNARDNTGVKGMFAGDKLSGSKPENFAISGSIATGPAFALHSTLCAHVELFPVNAADYYLNRVTVHGKVVTNFNTSGITW